MITFISDKNRKLSKTFSFFSQDLSYSSFCKLLRTKQIKVNGKRISKDVDLFVGDKVEIFYNPPKKEKFLTLYKDDNVIVINKRSGYTSEEVFSDLCSAYPSVKFIHRLDRNTSGIMIFALNKEAEKELLSGFKKRTFEKFYYAEVMGKMPKKEDVLTSYLLKDEEQSVVKIFPKKVKNSVEIKTGYKVIKENTDTTLLEVCLFTGKTHQIRAHLAFIGHPIIGDGKYGDNEFNKKMKVKTQKLISNRLVLHFDSSSFLKYLDKKEFVLEK